jgi:hypothetical protein
LCERGGVVRIGPEIETIDGMPYLVRVQRIVRARVVGEERYVSRSYWRANVFSWWQHHVFGMSCNTYKRKDAAP